MAKQTKTKAEQVAGIFRNLRGMEQSAERQEARLNEAVSELTDEEMVEYMRLTS